MVDNPGFWAVVCVLGLGVIYLAKNKGLPSINISRWTFSTPAAPSLGWLLNKWLLSFIAIVAAGALLYWLGIFSLLLGMEVTETLEEWQKNAYLKPWITIVGAVGAAMLFAALVIAILALLGWIGRTWALRLVLGLVLAALLAVYALAMGKFLQGLHSDTFWTLVIILLLLLVLTFGSSNTASRVARAALVVLLLFIAGPSIMSWINNNTSGCIGDEETCRAANSARAAREAERAYQRQVAVEKAVRDASRKVSLGCQGDMGIITLRPGMTPEINAEGCAMPVDVVEGAVVFVGRWFERSKAFRPGECIRTDFMPTAVEAAPGVGVARLHYAKCTGNANDPLTFDCVPRQSIPACS